MAYSGYPFLNADERLKIAVWGKAFIVPGHSPALSPDLWRWDVMGNLMFYDDHGAEGPYGWEIDHVYPAAFGGSDALANLQPLHWRENRRKGDTYPWPRKPAPPTGGLLGPKLLTGGLLGPTSGGGIIGRKNRLTGLLSD